MNSNWNSDFFDRYLHNECSNSECELFQKELTNSAELRQEFEQFCEYRTMVNESKQYSAPEDFTDNVIREIKRKAAPSPINTLFKGLFRREIIGVAVSVLILTVVFWPHMQSITQIDESTILEEFSAYQIEQSAPDTSVNATKEKEVIISADLSEEDKAPEKGKRPQTLENRSEPVSPNVISSNKEFRTAAPKPQKSVRRRSSNTIKQKDPSKEKQAKSETQTKPAITQSQTYSDAISLEEEVSSLSMKAKQPRESKKLKRSEPTVATSPEINVYTDSYQMESMEMTMDADLNISGVGGDQFPSPKHRGLEENQLPRQILKSTAPSDFPFENYRAVVTGTDTLHVTIPRRYLRRLSRDWIEYGGTVLDTIENDSDVTIKLISN